MSEAEGEQKLARHLGILKKDYNMDLKVWEASERGFPFNISIELITWTILLVPIAMSLFMIPFSNT
jgi:hypothetical protein